MLAIIDERGYIVGMEAGRKLAQTWTYDPLNRSILQVSSHCVFDIEGKSFCAGNRIHIWKNHSGENQKWTLIPLYIPGPEVSLSVVHRICSEEVVSGARFRLEPADNSPDPGTQIIMTRSSPRPNQLWIMEGPIIRHYLNDLVLEVKGDLVDGNQIVQAKFSGAPNQLWEWVSRERKIRSRMATLVFEVTGILASESAKLILQAPSSNPSQRFMLKKRKE